MTIQETMTALIEGAEADIWYDPQDADNEQDAAAIAAIERAQTAMVTAAGILCVLLARDSDPLMEYLRDMAQRGDDTARNLLADL
tara:strand:+ start:423 stop:677 length:255 start_codon:yes stop_codon:yes gene_type:complete